MTMYEKIAQIGNVVLEDNVEVGANTTIDRATMGSTIIRRGVKLDNLIQVAHNVEIGENTVMAAQVGVAGSTKIGKHNMVGGQVGFAGHIHIGDNCNFGAQSGVPNSVGDGKTLLGTPAIDSREFAKMFIYSKNLAALNKQVAELKKKHPELLVFLTGGDQKSLIYKIKSCIFADEFLVLKGLNRILTHHDNI